MYEVVRSSRRLNKCHHIVWEQMTLIGGTVTIQQPTTVKINLNCEFFHVNYLQFQGEAYVSYVNQLLLHKE